MKKIVSAVLILSLAAVGVFGISGVAMAAPHQGNSGNDFVCPVQDSQDEHNGKDPGTTGLANNPMAGPLGDTGTWTVVPGTSQANNMNVPDNATNGNGTGSPGDPNQSAPGDTDYTAIWNGD